MESHSKVGIKPLLLTKPNLLYPFCADTENTHFPGGGNKAHCWFISTTMIERAIQKQ